MCYNIAAARPFGPCATHYSYGRNAMKKYFALALLLILTALTGCSAQQTQADFTISRNQLTAEPLFADVKQGKTAMQIIALLDADGTPRLAYNTCQVCAGSPYAYFAYQQGALVCQNCGNAFDLSSVGQAAGGCNPLPVTDYQTDADTITIPAAALKQASAAFANWKKGLQ